MTISLKLNESITNYSIVASGTNHKAKVAVDAWNNICSKLSFTSNMLDLDGSNYNMYNDQDDDERSIIKNYDTTKTLQTTYKTIAANGMNNIRKYLGSKQNSKVVVVRNR